MPTQRVKSHLEENGVPYATIQHATAFTAQEEAAAAHVSGREWAKTVVFYADDGPAVAVLPATHFVDLERLARAAGAEHVRLALEEEMTELFPECEVGAVPPFGRLWGYPVYCDASLESTQRIAFHAGSHREAVVVDTRDFLRLLDGVVADFARHGEASAA